MSNSLYENFANHARAVIVAPAGCGKTELIARSTGCCKSRQLILTHTHAGVDSLRSKLRKLRIPSSLYQVETIHSFALRYASAYPKTSSIKTPRPESSEDYIDIIESANRLMETRLARDILRNSYAGVFVDEYQDCMVVQHELILKIAGIIPCRIVGDPLQGIFGFGGNKIVNWENDIYPNFAKMDILIEPWRWKKSNPQLGDWLMSEVRTRLRNDQPVSLQTLPVDCEWESFSDSRVISILDESLSFDGTTFAICAPEISIKPHSIAKNLKNRYKSIEPITSKEICDFASKFEGTERIERLKSTFEFAKTCLTVVGRDCGESLNSIMNRPIAFRNSRKIRLLELAKQVVENDSLDSILTLFEFLESEYDPTIYRYQLWREMKAGLIETISGSISNLEEAVWLIRNRAGIIGRRIPKRCVSRTVLLKGLECEHAIIVNADSLDHKNLYVALTRPSRRLTILSKCPVLLPVDKRPNCSMCGSQMIPKNGKNGPFLGCSKYPNCKHTMSL